MEGKLPQWTFKNHCLILQSIVAMVEIKYGKHWLWFHLPHSYLALRFCFAVLQHLRSWTTLVETPSAKIWRLWTTPFALWLNGVFIALQNIHIEKSMLHPWQLREDSDRDKNPVKVWPMSAMILSIDASRSERAWRLSIMPLVVSFIC